MRLEPLNEEIQKRKEDLKEDIEDEQWWDDLKFWRDEEDIEEDKKEIQEMIEKNQSNDILLPEDHTHKKADDLLPKDDPYYATKVAIDNFWDKDVKIRDKLWSNEDFKRYKIKDWDVDKKINKLFSSKNLI